MRKGNINKGNELRAVDYIYCTSLTPRALRQIKKPIIKHTKSIDDLIAMKRKEEQEKIKQEKKKIRKKRQVPKLDLNQLSSLPSELISTNVAEHRDKEKKFLMSKKNKRMQLISEFFEAEDDVKILSIARSIDNYKFLFEKKHEYLLAYTSLWIGSIIAPAAISMARSSEQVEVRTEAIELKKKSGTERTMHAKRNGGWFKSSKSFFKLKMVKMEYKDRVDEPKLKSHQDVWCVDKNSEIVRLLNSCNIINYCCLGRESDSNSYKLTIFEIERYLRNKRFVFQQENIDKILKLIKIYPSVIHLIDCNIIQSDKKAIKNAIHWYYKRDENFKAKHDKHDLLAREFTHNFEVFLHKYTLMLNMPNSQEVTTIYHNFRVYLHSVAIKACNFYNYVVDLIPEDQIDDMSKHSYKLMRKYTKSLKNIDNLVQEGLRDVHSHAALWKMRIACMHAVQTVEEKGI